MALLFVALSFTSHQETIAQTQTQTQPELDPEQDKLQQLLESMVTSATQSPAVIMTLIFTLLSLLLCFGVASRADAFRVGFHRRIIRPVTTPFRRLISSSPEEEDDATFATKEEKAELDYSTTTSISSAASRTLQQGLASFDMWNDLAPPFVTSASNKNTTTTTTTTNATSGGGGFVIDHDYDLTAHIESPDVTHFCFLLHGHRGLSKDLAYMQVMMQRMAAVEKQKRMMKTQPAVNTGECSTKDNHNNNFDTNTTTTTAAIHDMVVHSSVCNEGKTNDGIRNGGDRLVEEMRQVIEDEMIKRHPELDFLRGLRAERGREEEHHQQQQRGHDDGEDLTLILTDNTSSAASSERTTIYDVTISILGNSLGGLFGRYAIAKLIERHCVLEPESDCWILDGRFRLHLNIFCTTATPHLGVSRHTYVKIPRTAEIGVAHAMGNTGKDLFRLNDLLHSMATTPTFLKPLSKFRKRIAYANAYGTDFPVPASTAAFLSENSTYPHHIVETKNTTSTTRSTTPTTSEDGSPITTTTTSDETHGGMVIATLHTPAQPHGESDSEEEENDRDDDADGSSKNSSSSSSSSGRKSGDQEDELDHMSRSLDRLGWKKVFVDIRRELPSAELPSSAWLLRRFNSDPSSMDNNNESGSGSGSVLAPAVVPNLQSLQMQNRVVESREVATAVASPMDNRIALPLGHNMIVAFSRSRLTTFMNKGGRPVVDSLAKELVEEIFTWNETKLASDLSKNDNTLYDSSRRPSSSSTVDCGCWPSPFPNGATKSPASQ